MTTKRRTTLRSFAGQRLALAVLAAGLVVTATASTALAADVAKDRRGELDGLALQARTAIERRVASYVEPLYGMGGILSGPHPAPRAAFHDYVELAGTARRQPGLLAYTFNRLVPAGGVEGFERAVRADTSLVTGGYPEFRVHPAATAGADRLVIDFIEPRAGNEAIFGYDAATDPVRRRGFEAARDSGRVVATAPVELLQSNGQTGFLLYLAVYDTARIPDTAPARRRHFTGVVTAAVGLDQMLAGVLGGTTAERPNIDVKVEDVGSTLGSRSVAATGGAVLFESARQADRRWTPSGSRSVDLNVGGRRWRLIATPRPGFGSRQAELLPWLVGMGGGVLSVLLAGLLVSLSGSKRRAVALAGQMTTSLRRREEELRRANDHLAESNTALARADQVKDAFLGTMSHELRTPLTAISGFARLLEGRWDRLGPEERHESLTLIMRSADTLGRLVDDLLEFNRTGDHAPALSLETLELDVVARETLDELGPLTTTHHLRLDAGRVTALADRSAVTRILTNLVTNAVKFSPEGTTVTVTTRRHGDMAVLEVADEGSGVPPDQRLLVFERFYRGTQAGHARRPGTGIGLAVVKELAERMGGSVRIDDTPTGGSVFRIELSSNGSWAPGTVVAVQPGVAS